MNIEILQIEKFCQNKVSVMIDAVISYILSNKLFGLDNLET